MKNNIQAIRENISSHPSRKWFILSTVLLGATMSALDISIVNVATPTLKTAFGVSMAVIEWITMAYMLTLTIFLPLFGKLADIFGRSKLYNLGFVIFSGGSLLCGISTSAAMMIGARVIQAIGAGLLQANSVALITEAFPAKERGKAIGVQGAAQAVSMAIGPFVGGILIAAVGWQAIFFVNIPIGILGIIAGLFILPARQQEQRKEKIDYLGAALFALGLALVVLAFNEGVKLGWASPAILMYFVAGSVLLSLFVLTELKVENPLIDLKLFKNPTFLLGNLTGMLSYYVLFAVLFLLPFYLEKVLGYSVAVTGLLMTPLLLAMAVVAPLSGLISDKYGPRLMTTSGMLLSALACFALMFMGATTQMPLLVASVIVLGTGMGLFTTSNNSAIMGSAPSEKLGMAGGVLNMTRSLGLILGVDISGGVFTTLEHRYLSQQGYPDIHRVFSNTSVPLLIKDNAFMHGFLVVAVILLGVNILSAFLSAIKSGKEAAIIDHELAGTMVISSGFFSGFSQEAKGTALFVVLLLFTGIIGAIASSRLSGEGLMAPQTIQFQNQGASNCTLGTDQPSPTEAKQLALSYYTEKYHDSAVRIAIVPQGDHLEANVIKNGMLVKRLIIRGKSISEDRTGLNQWLFDLLTNVNYVEPRPPTHARGRQDGVMV